MPTHDFVDIGDVLGFELLQGTIASVDSLTDTCTVTVGGSTLPALLFYHCEPGSILRSNGAIEGASKGFSIGNQVIVLKQIKDSAPVIKVIGHIDGIRRCSDTDAGDYYLYYDKNSVFQIALCDSIPGAEDNVIDTKKATDCYALSGSGPVQFFIKKFTHNVSHNGVITEQTLYFICMTIHVNPTPCQGFVNFCIANPDFALVTNSLNTEIPYTSNLMDDLILINTKVNSEHAKVLEGGTNDNWHILGEGEGGDCEDFALTKAKELLDLGYPASALHIECGIYTESPGVQKGHAWLVVQTSAGDYALDVNSNLIIANASLMFSGKELFLRSRQIGLRWSSLSPYSWLQRSGNYANYYFYYILDPLMNILHPMRDTNEFGTPKARLRIFESFSYSVNFSEDNNTIYLVDSGESEYSSGTRYEYRLVDNKLDMFNSEPVTCNGFVERDGTINQGTQTGAGVNFHYWTEVISVEGGFEFNYVHSIYDEIYIKPVTPPMNYDWIFWDVPVIPRAYWETINVGGDGNYYHTVKDDTVYNKFIISKEFGRACALQTGYTQHVTFPLPSMFAVFEYTYRDNWYTPYGIFDLEYDENHTYHYSVYPWANIDCGGLLCHGFRMWKNTNNHRRKLYKNGIDVMSNLLTLAGISSGATVLEEDFQGIVFMPRTDRLNEVL